MLEAAEMRNARILIVDDQDASVRQLHTLLLDAGYKNVFTCSDAGQACSQHAQQHFDLILLSLDLLAYDGLLVMHRFRQIDARCSLLLNSRQKPLALQEVQIGAMDFFSVPYLEFEVLARVHNLLENCLLRKRLASYSHELENEVQQRTDALRKSEASFRSFAELSSDWFWEQDKEGHFTTVSGPVFEMLGIENEKSLLPNPAGTLNDDLANDERGQLHKKILTRLPFLDYVYSHTRSDGTVQYLQVSGEPMFDSGSRFIGYRGIGMEITDRRRPDQEQIRFRRAMDVIDIGILLVDRSSMHLVDLNDTVCRLSGYERAELLVKPPGQLGFGDEHQLALTFDNLIGGRESHEQNAQLACQNGTLLDVRLIWHVAKLNEQWVMVGVLTRKDGMPSRKEAVG